VEDRARLRGDLALVLSEPESTGEPLDWQEIENILREWAETAGWEGALAPAEVPAPNGPFTIDLRPREAESLDEAPEAVRRAAHLLLQEFLPLHPTAGERLPRGELKKLKNREIWQIDLPDGYRLRYLVDKLGSMVHIVYLGPHPDGRPRGREQRVRARVHSARRDNHE
jgi:hypothetical protein